MQLIIFDIDGTLTDTKAVDDDCFLRALKDEFGIEPAHADWSLFANVTDTGLFRDIYHRHKGTYPGPEERKKFETRLYAHFENEQKNSPEKFREVPGAVDFFHTCIAHGDYKVAIATGAWSTTAKIKLSMAGIRYEDVPFAHADGFLTRQEILADAIRQAEEAFPQARFNKTVYFGDGEWDFYTTKSMSIPFIGVDVWKNGKLKNLGAQHIIENYSDMNAVFSLL